VIQLQPPSQLGKLATYRQACKLASKTSRASNPDWYRAPYELDCQWHLAIASTRRIASAIFLKNSNTWINGPKVTIDQLLSVDKATEVISDLRHLPECRKIRSLGFILHVADEFATTEIQSDIRNHEELPELRDEIAHSPMPVLGDSSLSPDSTSWRLIPYAGAINPPLATTVSISRTHEPIVENLRAIANDTNFPIATAAISAPLAFLSVLPSFVEFDGSQPQIALLQYPKFSALAIFDPQGELLQLRALQHRGRTHPSNLGDAINTAVAALDISSPTISLIPMAEADPSPLITQLHATLADPESTTFSILKPSLEGVSDASELRPEMLAATPPYNASEVSTTFNQLSIFGENWAGQDFFSPGEEETALYPDRKDMALLRTAKITKPLLALVLIAAAGFVGFTLIQENTKPYASASQEQVGTLQHSIGLYQNQIAEYEHLSNILAPRSQAWTTMELLNLLVPDDGEMILTGVSHTVRTESATGDNSPIVRRWDISGLATQDGIGRLTEMSGRTGISKLFAEVAERTHSPAFAPNDETRSIEVNFRDSRNNRYRADTQSVSRSDPTSYPFEFHFNITQRMLENDPLALTTTSPSSQ